MIGWQSVLLILVVYIALDASMWVYLLRQAKGQLAIISNTHQVETLLSKNILTEKEKEKIKLIQEIKEFAESSLGLKKTSNYTTYYNQHGKPILWMLTACEPYAFNEKVWQFPMLGEVSYKGFFNYQLAVTEANQLKMQGYDVDMGKVSAWSTLGILSDPILSSMLDDGEGALAELIIHELTHATLYFANQVDYNENFASFIGRQGALHFMALKFGPHSHQMKTYQQEIIEETKLKTFLLQQKEQLANYYGGFTPELSSSEKKQMKSQKIDEIIKAFYQLNIYSWKTRIKIAQKIKISGNAYFMSFNRYDAQYEQLSLGLKQHHNNLKEFIIFSKQQSLK